MSRIDEIRDRLAGQEDRDSWYTAVTPEDVAFLLGRLAEIEDVVDDLVQHTQAPSATPLHLWRARNEELLSYLRWLTKDGNK